MVEEVLQTRAEEINHKDVVQTLLAEVVDVGDTGCKWELAWTKGGQDPHILETLTTSDQDLVRPVLIAQLGSITLARFLFQSALEFRPIKVWEDRDHARI